MSYTRTSSPQMCSLMMHTDKALSSQNIDVLSLIPGGCANKEIAAKRSITEETMKGHAKSIFQ
jgi:DNA-binding NarL/FixJ family response regulator